MTVVPPRVLAAAAVTAAALFAGVALATSPHGAPPHGTPAFKAPPAPKKTAALLAKGKASFATNCVTCHGPKGRGDGETAASLDPKPRDFVAEEFEHGATPAGIFATVTQGLAGTGMLSFAQLPEEERWALAYYVLELRGAKGAKGAKGAPSAGKGTTGPAKR